MAKILSRDIVGIFEIFAKPIIIIYELIKCCRTKIIIYHINVVRKLPRTTTIYFLSRNIS